MRDALAQEQELQGILAIADRMSKEDAAMIAASSSGARRRRDKTAPTPDEAYRKEVEDRVSAKREEIGLLWAKIHELQEKEKEKEMK